MSAFAFTLVAGDEEHFWLLRDVAAWKRRARLEWVATCDANVLGNGAIAQSGFLLNENGAVTAMPEYFEYDRTWRAAGYVNPFEFDWAHFNRGDRLMSRYLVTVIETLDEQVELWGDDETRECLAFDFFCKFTLALKTFYAYDVNAGETSYETYDSESDGAVAGLSP